MRKVLKNNLGLTLVVALITLLGGTALVVRSAGAAVTVNAGYDTFTTPNNAQTFDDFSSHPIPAGFFGTGSQEFKGRVVFKGGAPIDPARFGTADTVIERKESVQVPDDTALEVTGISFVSVSPITVSYANGSTTTCNVAVGKSAVKTSGGSMYFNADGTFTSNLTIYPKYSFNCANGSYSLDTGSTGGTSINLSSTNGTWSQSGRVTVVNPGSEQDLLASHNVVPAPTPCRTPVPQPTATVVPGPGPVDKIDSVDTISARSASRAAETNAVAISPCVATADTAVEAQP